MMEWRVSRAFLTLATPGHPLYPCKHSKHFSYFPLQNLSKKAGKITYIMYIMNLVCIKILQGLNLFVFLCYVRKLYNQYHQDHHHHHPLQEHVYLFLSTSAPGRCPSVAADMARGLIIRIIFFKSTFVFVLDLPVESSGILLLLFGHF